MGYCIQGLGGMELDMDMEFRNGFNLALVKGVDMKASGKKT